MSANNSARLTLNFCITVFFMSGSMVGFAKPEHANSAHGRDHAIPHGLEKKLGRGNDLPPGWQKKLVVGEKLDDHLYAHGEPVGFPSSEGLITISIDGQLLRLYEQTREIVEIIH